MQRQRRRQHQRQQHQGQLHSTPLRAAASAPFYFDAHIAQIQARIHGPTCTQRQHGATCAPCPFAHAHRSAAGPLVPMQKFLYAHALLSGRQEDGWGGIRPLRWLGSDSRFMHSYKHAGMLQYRAHIKHIFDSAGNLAHAHMLPMGLVFLYVYIPLQHGQTVLFCTPQLLVQPKRAKARGLT